ncbi:HNH endonuclease [Arenibacter sp. F26102]|uniref:HNH endonuclease n=1 Tax=Arenibacter sp. F26102 TaxID=2926416 RepID=UPI001FF5C508|nr:HNH endonuclease signature motif containing protein [Arenibacter sp. F26102]MCK0144320.1 HNH endonuclease [Arenibacter sp. F26102]
MPFNANTKARMFIKSARICCLCYKPCGTNIEAAHIIAEADGGSNTDDNGIPLCFDCHQEIGGYDDRHPKGNKFTNIELKTRRDKVYELVENGVLQAQLVTSQLSRNLNTEHLNNSNIEINIYKPTKEVKVIIELAQNYSSKPENIPLKLQLLNDREQAFVIDTLTEEFDNIESLNSLFAIITNENFREKSLVILEQILRKITILMDIDLKKDFMCNVPIDILKTTDEGLRIAFFTELIGILEQNQFVEVNKITACLIKIQETIPEALIDRYLNALIKMTDSGAWVAEPIAKRTLLSLDKELAKRALSQIEKELLIYDLSKDYYPKLIKQHSKNWPDEKKELFNNYLKMDKKEFNYKYMMR